MQEKLLAGGEGGIHINSICSPLRA